MTVHRVDRDTQTLDHASIIGDGSVNLSVGTLQHVSGESLGCLHGTQPVARDSGADGIVLADRPNGVDERNHRDYRRMPPAHRRNNSRDDLHGDERTRGIVDEDYVDVWRQSDQGTGNGLGSGFTAGNYRDVGSELLPIKKGAHVVDVLSGGCDNNDIHHGATGKSLHCIDEYRGAGEFPKRFRGAGTQPLPPTCGGDEGGDARPGDVVAHGNGVLGGQDLVEDGFRLVLVGLLSQGQLAHQNLAGLGQHALLASG